MGRRSARARELGEFLRARRKAIAPDSVGLPGDGTRRTPGLRREEAARLAGVSDGYYVRLEQGRAPHPSASVLAALARALRLSGAEREHLFALAEDHPDTGPEILAPGAGRMLHLLTPPTAAYVIGRRSDVLAWNTAAAALFPHLVPGPTRPNNVRYVFTDPEARELFADWEEIASDSVAHLRASAGHRPDDDGLTALVAELEETGADFRRLWAARELRRKVSGRKHLNHPVIGRVTLDYDVLAVPDSPGQRLVAYAAAPGTPSHAALTRLGALTTG